MSAKVYEVINNRILELLEQGTVPWRMPWNVNSSMPRSLSTKKEYIQGWLKALKNDRTLLIHAAAQAQKAADYILGRKHEEEQHVL